MHGRQRHAPATASCASHPAWPCPWLPTLTTLAVAVAVRSVQMRAEDVSNYIKAAAAAVVQGVRVIPSAIILANLPGLTLAQARNYYGCYWYYTRGR